MKERRPSREERRQREKEELSRQKLQEQAFLETQRNVFARIQRGEDYWDGRTMGSWDIPPSGWDPPPVSRPRPAADRPQYGGGWDEPYAPYDGPPPGWKYPEDDRYDTPVNRRYPENDRYDTPVNRRYPEDDRYDTPVDRRYPEDNRYDTPVDRRYPEDDRYDTPVNRRYPEDDRYDTPVNRRYPEDDRYDTPVNRRYPEDDRYDTPVNRRYPEDDRYDTPVDLRYPEGDRYDTPAERAYDRPHEDDTMVRRSGPAGYDRDSEHGSRDSREDTQVRRTPPEDSPQAPFPEDGEPPVFLNPAITNMHWDPPEEPPPRKRSKKKIVLVIVLILAILLGALAVVHQLLVRAPELPGAKDEGVAPSLLEAGRKEGVYTFLLVGRDDGGGGNTDTIMVGSFDTVNGTVDVLSIFRDTLVDVPWEIKKINSVYNVQGIEGLQEQVKNLVGFTPDYYFVVEMSALAQLVDAIGGVDYEIPYNMDYDDPTQDLHIHFPQGMQHLNGEDAVKVLRWRKNNSGDQLSVGDVGRVEIQHDFLKNMAKQALSLGNVTKIRQVARIVDENLDSDLSYGEMFWFGERALGMQGDGIRFHSLPGDYGGTMWSKTYQNYQSYVFVNDGELLELVNQYMNPYLEDIPAESQHVLNGTTVSSQAVLPGKDGGSVEIVTE